MANLSERIRAMRYDYAIMRHMPRFRRQIREEKNRYITAQMEFYKIAGMLSPEITGNHEFALTVIFKDNYRRIMKAAMQAAPLKIEGLKSVQWMELKYDDHDWTLIQYVQKFGAQKIKNISKRTEADIRRLIVRAFTDGEPEHEVIKAGLKARALSAYRADTIARTETSMAAAFASRYSVEKIASESGLTLKKKWMPTLDDRTRPDHAEMADSEYIPMDEKFYVGGEYLEYPSDPSGSAGNVINCRCAEIHKVAR